jgi:hypothetical protein
MKCIIHRAPSQVYIAVAYHLNKIKLMAINYLDKHPFECTTATWQLLIDQQTCLSYNKPSFILILQFQVTSIYFITSNFYITVCEEQYLLPQYSQKQDPLLCSPPQILSLLLSSNILPTIYSPGATYIQKNSSSIQILYHCQVLTIYSDTAWQFCSYMYMHNSK